jgi:beta-lactamase regulating signal transducer with metallopeptidase domain
MLGSESSAGLLITLAAQSFLISLLGVLAMKCFAGKSAPVRSLICSGAIAAMCLVPAFSIGLQLSGNAWYEPKIPSAWIRVSEPAVKSAVFAAPLRTPPGMKVSSSKTPNPIRTKDFESRAQLKRTPVQTGFWINILGLVWLIGFVFLLLKLGYGLIFLKGFRFGLLRFENKGFEGLAKNVASSFPKSRSPELYLSPKVESPITMGLLSPIVIIPEKLRGNLNEKELKSILLHELAHIYSCDHVVGLVKRIALAAHWWNPLAYWINAEHDEAREEVCDNYVLSELKPKEYSKCLADLAEKICLVNHLPAAAAMAGRGFSLQRRVESILSNKRSLAMHTSLNLRIMTFSVCGVLTLFIAGVHGQADGQAGSTGEAALKNPQSASVEATIIGLNASNLSLEQVAELEKAVAQNPDDLKSETLLLSYYFSQQYSDKALGRKKDQIVLWLIQNHPKAGVLGSSLGQVLSNAAVYLEGEKLWKEQLRQNPNDLQILWNAGNYFLHQDLDLSISLYKQGNSLDPENPIWDQQLGNAYNLKMIKSPAKENLSLANEALNSFENAQAETKVENRSDLLPNMAKAALAAGQLAKAADYANQMLSISSSGWNKGNLIYFGNFTFGMLAVKKGDLDAAEKYLLAAGDTPGSPQLNSFGPNMSLAKELLDLGRRDSVLAFLKKCSKFWTITNSPCGRWIQEMEEGKTPDFPMNLIY